MRAVSFGVSLCLTSLLLLAGCQTPPQTPASSPQAPMVADHEWQGHFSVKLGPWAGSGPEGQSFTFYLRSARGEAQLDLMTPLGTQLAQVRWSPSGTWIQSSKGTESYASLEDLSVQLLGEAVPLQALPYWLDGVPTPGSPAAHMKPDHSGFEQSGWTIDTQSLPDGYLQATRPESGTQRLIIIKVRLER
ncbi:MAG TPA: lipoprotein insertase outer membrane protein LolB [Aquabacterium sp.]|nr:lipoprotein insertase outer membrane protein LolB [Aquabacterium sp.]